MHPKMGGEKSIRDFKNLSFDLFAFVAVFFVIGNGNIRFGFSSAVFPLAGGPNANQRG